MKKTLVGFSLVCINVVSLFSQEIPDAVNSLIPSVKIADNLQVKFGGFVRAEYYFDTREMEGALDDLFCFFPENKKPGADGKDLNNVFRHNLSTQATRFNALLTGPDFLNAKSSAFFEYDFTGGNSINIRVRHAWLKLNWERAELLVGKTWNPFAQTPFPGVAGLHTGVPFRPFGRGDQVRLTYNLNKNFNVLLAGVFQSEHKSVYEPQALNDIRANPAPDLHLQFHFKNRSLFAGIMGEYKIIKPATYTTGTAGTFKTSETINSYGFGGFADFKKELFHVKASVIYGQNLSELFQQGGYAVKTYNPETGSKTYTPSNSLSSWIHLSYGKRWITGLFGGYQKNLGFSDNILLNEDFQSGENMFFGRWQNIDHIYRIAPSVKYLLNQWEFHFELDYNVAAYGNIDAKDKGKVKDAKEVSGVRGIFAATFYY